MPFQNTGTLLENIVVLEAARQLLEQTTGPIDWASAFSMPPLTVWRRAERYAREDSSFSIQELNRLASNPPPRAPNGYAAFLHRCLQHSRVNGPNATLLVGLLAQQKERSLRAWVEDVPVPTSHYGPTQAPLDALGTYVSVIGYKAHSPFDRLSVCSQMYPDCIASLDDTLQHWSKAHTTPAARLGYLDPNVYVSDTRAGPQTSAPDHRQWLRALSRGTVPWSVSVHFSSNRNQEALVAGLRAMRVDGNACGYQQTTSYVHHTHSTTVSVTAPSAEEASAYTQATEDRIQDAWSSWMAACSQNASPRPLYRYRFVSTDAPSILVEGHPE